MYDADPRERPGRDAARERPSVNRAGESAAPPDQALGRVISVSGTRVIAEFAANGSWSDERGFGLTVGSLLGIRNGAALAVTTLCEIAFEKPASGGVGAGAIGQLDLLGEIVADESGRACFQVGVVAYPKLGNAIVPLGREDLQIVFGLASAQTVEVGLLQQNVSIAAAVNVDELVRKHFAIVGSTGSGKSSGLALILRKIMTARSDLRMLIIDAHNEYADCFDDRAEVFGSHNLQLPFWLFNFDEIVEIVFGSPSRAEREVALLAELIPLAKTEYARTRHTLRASYRPVQSAGGRFTADTPVPYRLEDVIAAAESRMGKLENRDQAVTYQRLLARIDAARRNPRYSFIFDDDDDGDDGMISILCRLLRLADDGRPIAVVQLAGFPAEAIEVIVSVLLRLAFEFGVWSDGCSPLLVVCEEAHNYANADPAVGFPVAREGLARIAKEGRKHGVFLGLVTQRPHQLDPTLISQCSKVFAMRLGHEDDQKIVRAAVSDSASRQLAFLPSLGTREALVIGAGVSTVMRMRFEELPAACIPRTQAGWVGHLDAVRKIDDDTVAAVVARWRGIALDTRPAAPEPVLNLKLRSGDTIDWSAPAHSR
jgi:DNA helicase HerA-like ATPase